MPLKFPGAWRFRPPIGRDGEPETIPDEAVREYFSLVAKTASQGNRRGILEHFKSFFCAANDATHILSSSESWAEADLRDAMSHAAKNPPLFLEALYDSFSTIESRFEGVCPPDTALINTVCEEHGVGYVLKPPSLERPGPVEAASVTVPERPASLAERALATLQESLQRADQLLVEGRSREAVQESLWLLETVSTAFRGLDSGSGSIGGKYFNKIVRELRKAHTGSTLDRVLEWTEALHGYLSSPTGGAVRHGLDLKEGLAITQSEARLFCNLIRSYMSYLLSEYERLSAPR